MASSLARKEPRSRSVANAPTGRPMSATLAEVAAEVRDLATLSDRLQPFISAALVADGAANADHLREFQAIDLLVQRLQGVAAFVGALAQSAPTEWRIDAAGAASTIALADLANRLSGARSPETPLEQLEPPPAGDFELFG